MWRFLLGPLVALQLHGGPALAQKRIALSFDDVPRHAGAFFTPDERTTALIAALRRSGVQQAGFFVTTGNLLKPDGHGGAARIAAQVAAGHVVGNHSKTHSWLSRTSVQDYLADIDSAEAWLGERAGHRPWFRFPYLDEGKRDLEKRDAIRRGLQHRGLSNAYVTVDDHDWYLDALASRAKRQALPIDEAYADPIAGIEPDTWFLGSGRVAALAHVAGWKPRTLVHERTDEEALDRLFDACLVVPSR